MTQFLGTPKVQYFKTGKVDYLAGGKLYSYDAGTTTPRPTYPTMSDALASTNPNTNPVILDARGEANVVVKGATKLILMDADDTVIWTTDNVDQSAVDVFDVNGNLLLQFLTEEDAVNAITITNAATADSPKIEASGNDGNIGLEVSSKGSGKLFLDGGASGTVEIGTASTGNINLKRNTNVTGNLSTSGTLTATGKLTSNGGAELSGTTLVKGPLNADPGVPLGFLPAGTVVWKASTNVPVGWLECDGRAINRSDFPALFADIGVAFGAGNGSTTFNIPAQHRRTLVGRGGPSSVNLGNTVASIGGTESHLLLTEEMPAHFHGVGVSGSVIDAGSGDLSAAVVLGGTTNTSIAGANVPHNNMQPSLVMMMIIKAF